MNKKTILTTITAILMVLLPFVQYMGNDCIQSRYEGYIENMLQAKKHNDNIILKMLEEQKEWIRGQQGKALESEDNWMSERDKRNDAYIKANNFLKNKCDGWNVFFIVIVILALIFTLWNKPSRA